MIVGLRIDVDTYRGTRLGVPALIRLLGAYGILATFFFSVGPDNMGRHLWRLFRPRFLGKLLRSRAPALYGWDMIFRGTLWRGPIIGLRLSQTIRSAAQTGHEVGLHAWDHHAWQDRLDRMTAEDIQTVTRRGVESLAEITGRLPSCAAAPGWRCNDLALREQATFPFLYQSDCRGRSVFLPNVAGRILNRPQVPVTLPTYDELIGRGGVRDDNYNEHLLALLDPVGLNVLTVHAEVEGIARHELFQDFLDRARSAGVRFVPLADLIPRSSELPFARIDQRTLPGRQGLVACQGPTEGSVPWPGLEHQTAEGHAQ